MKVGVIVAVNVGVIVAVCDTEPVAVADGGVPVALRVGEGDAVAEMNCVLVQVIVGVAV